MEEYRDDKKGKLYYMDEILHKISSMSQAENEKQLDDITPSILKSVRSEEHTSELHSKIYALSAAVYFPTLFSIDSVMSSSCFSFSA